MRTCEQILDTAEHCTDITVEEVQSYLSKIQPDISNDKFTISQENDKTRSFLEGTEYIITKNKIKSILLDLTYKNFCWYQKGENAGDLLFIFRYDGNFIKLIKGGPKEDTLIIYIKTNKKSKGTLVLSFHPSDKPDELTPLFK